MIQALRRTVARYANALYAAITLIALSTLSLMGLTLGSWHVDRAVISLVKDRCFSFLVGLVRKG